MTDIRLPASGAVRIRYYAPGAFAKEGSPTVTELNAGMDIDTAISWNDFSLGQQASNTISDPDITVKSNVTARGAAKYGGALSFYYPKQFDDASNIYSLTFDALGKPRTGGYIVMSIDGDLSDTNTPLYTNGAIQNFAAGDYLNVYKILTTGYAQSIVGEEAFRYTVTLSPQGVVYPYTVAKTSAATVVVTPATTSKTVAGGPFALTATVVGRPYTRGLRWTTSDATKATVSQNGVVTPKATGSVTITGTFVPDGTSSSSTITLT